MRDRLLVATLLPASDPVMDATLGRHLGLIGVAADDVTLICGQPGARPAWAGRVVAVPVRPRLTWPVRFAAAVRTAVRGRRPAAIYARDELSAAVLSLLPASVRGPVLLLDKRGLPVAEARMNRRPWPLTKLLSLAERLTSRRAARVMTVTSVIARHLEGLSATDVVVVPNGYAGADLRLSERQSPPVVAYVGGGQAWQCCDEALALLRALRDGDPELDVRVYTTDPDLRRKAELLAVPARQVSRADLLTEMPTFTAIVALRRPDATSLSASPVKLAEALQHGVDVIATSAAWEGIGALARATPGVKLVEPDLTYDPADLLTWVRSRSRVTARERRRELSGASSLELDSYVDRLRHFYLGDPL